MGYKIDTTRLDEIISKLNGNADRVCRRAAFEIEAQAKQLAPVDLGALTNSIYTVTQNEDGYTAASAAAVSKNPKVQTAAIPKPEGNARARVGPCVVYGLRVELGFHDTDVLGRRYNQAGHPYMKPAVEIVSKRYVQMWKEGLI